MIRKETLVFFAVIAVLTVGVVSATHERSHVDVEPNNNQISGAVIVDDGCYEGGVATDFDDYYGVNLTEGELLETSIKFNRTDGDLRFEILNPGEQVIASSNSMTNNVASELATVTANKSGTHYLRVYSAEGGTAYSLSVKTGTVREEVDVEPNNNQISGAVVVDDGCYEGGVATGFDDYYGVNLTQGESLNTSIKFNRQGSKGNLQLEILSPDEQVIASSQSMMDNESANITADRSGTYYLRIFSDEDGSAYSLSINTFGGEGQRVGGGSEGGAGDLNVPDSVSPDGEFTVEYSIGQGDSHQVEIDPNGFEVNVTSYSGNDDFTNLGSGDEDSRTNPNGVALFDALVTGDRSINVDVIGGTAGENATVELRALDSNGDVVGTNTAEVELVDEHPSGVPQSVFDAVAGQNGDPGEVERGDVVDSIDAFFSGQGVSGESLTRSDMVNIIDWFFSN